MQNLESLIHILKFCLKEQPKVASRGCGECSPLEGIDCYVLKCTKITLFAKISVLVTTHPFFCMFCDGK